MDETKRPLILRSLARASTETAIAGTDDHDIITAKTMKDVIDASGGIGKRNVFKSGGILGEFTATTITNTFTIPDMTITKEADLVFNGLLLIENKNYTLNKETGVVILGFQLKPNETIDYEIHSTSFSYNDLVDIPEGPCDIVDNLTTTVKGKSLDASQGKILNDIKADKSYVDTKVAELVGSAPETLDTLKELGDALGNDPNFATTVSTKLGELTTKDTDLTKQITDCNGEIGKVKDKIEGIDVTTDVEEVVTRLVNSDRSTPLNTLINNVKTAITNSITTAKDAILARVTEINNAIIAHVSSAVNAARDVVTSHVTSQHTTTKGHVTTKAAEINNNTNAVRDNLKAHVTDAVNKASTQQSSVGVSLIKPKTNTTVDIINVSNPKGGEACVYRSSNSYNSHNVWIDGTLVINSTDFFAKDVPVTMYFKSSLRIQQVGSTHNYQAWYHASWKNY